MGFFILKIGIHLENRYVKSFMVDVLHHTKFFQFKRSCFDGGFFILKIGIHPENRYVKSFMVDVLHHTKFFQFFSGLVRLIFQSGITS